MDAVSPAGHDEHRSLKLIGEAAKIAERPGKLPAGFVAALFSHASPEDVVAYGAEDLAALAEAGYAFLQTRAAGETKIRIANPAARGKGPLARVTVIEIANDDMPFLLDSVMGEIGAHHLNVMMVAHPIFTVERDGRGKLTGWQKGREHGHRDRGPSDARRESFIHIHIERIEEARFAAIEKALQSLFAELRVSVADWRRMLDHVQDAIGDLQTNARHLPKDEVWEAADFAAWLVEGNFTFLGCREYAFSEKGGKGELKPIFENALGILRNADVPVLQRQGKLLNLTPELLEFMHRPVAMIVTKSNLRSRIHRRVHMDYIGIKRFDADGNPAGELRIVGLFTSSAYMHSARTIPYLRRKIAKVAERAGFDPASHSGKALVNVLESYPRDELFQIDDDLLLEFALAILQLEERPRIRVLARRDRFDRFVSILVYVPRDRYDSEVRARLGEYFADVFKGRVSAFYPSFPDGQLARVHFIIGRDEGKTPNPDQETLEAAVARITRNWSDDFLRALTERHGGARAHDLAARYGEAFSAGYREAFGPESAIDDLAALERLSPERRLSIDFYRRDPAQLEKVHLKVWSFQEPLALSARVPVLEHMGFSVIDERTYALPGKDKDAKGNAACNYLHDMTLARAGGGEIDLDRLGGALEAALMAVAAGRAEDDGFNGLTLAAGMAWRDVALVRTLARYLRQAGVPYSQDYLWTTLNRHSGIAQKLVALFHARFAPAQKDREQAQTALGAEIEKMLEAVESLDEDRILREFRALVMAGLRTNFYQPGKNGQPKETIAIKFESRKIDLLPLPKPLYEIFVYSPRVEGVHLRFGKVARGGIRWSDRPQDFRTEILGLVKAQQVKNAVIVPVGAKGGFVPKQLPAVGGRDAWLKEGTEAYKIFIGSMLDITDNIEGAKIVHPENVVRYDDDDPYFVVAADKGTATFSDTANNLAIERGFWLGDAFASGGSAGYDHKGMGITARGAWESVKRHFREMDVDIGKTPFTVTGVGDMSGDVFGNGMLRENTIKLIAAFDHRDIFLDPSPDPARAFAERERIYRLPRSSWQDYDKSLISKGGGVFSRSAKSIALSPEARAALGIEKSDVTPAELMSAILRAPVDLLWFGGIGTYIRASSETDAQAGDRTNDAIRIAARELRCKVIGEGANLGMTQRGRIEAARGGVRLNTDAIDNSAGVNTSDVEVNIKIALSKPAGEGKLKGGARNELLAAMTDDVAALVLRNNYQQSLALSLAERQAAADLGFEQRAMEMLETRGLLDRGVEYLPSNAEIAERRKRGEGLTRPELAVMLAYAKLTLYSDLLTSSVPDDPYLARELKRYFPPALAERFPDAIEHHRLRREIIATMLANSIVNRGGPSFVARVADEADAEPAAIARAFAVVRDSFGMTDFNGEIDALDNKISGALQLELYAEVENLLLNRTIWFIRNTQLSGGLDELVAHYREGVDRLANDFDTLVTAQARQAIEARAAKFREGGVPQALAQKIARLPLLAAATDIVLIADKTGKPIETAASAYFATREFFRLDGIFAAARAIDVQDRFERLAIDRAVDSIAANERVLIADILGHGGSGEAAVAAWSETRKSEIVRVRSRLQELDASGFSLAKLIVAASLMRDLVKE
ncbi:MAG TPA: NAD-glutamate dehydrogenase [Xanthobacteraceae bacterium]|nr:NAD-glutamate dehydrogenase [Xanthobacteraceae bacterium]